MSASIGFFFFFLGPTFLSPYPIFRRRLEALRNGGGKQREKLQQNRLISRINKSFIGN